MAKPYRSGSSSPGSPGLFGAIKDAIEAVAKETPVGRKISQRPKRIEEAVNGDDLGRLRKQQTSDRHN